MESNTLAKYAFAAVFSVADDWHTTGRKLNSDLVLSPGHQFDPDKTIGFAMSDPVKTQSRNFCTNMCFRDGHHPMIRFIFDDVMFQTSACFANGGRDNRQVVFFRLSQGKLFCQPRRRFGSSGKNDNSGDV